ncbi:Mov34/MPN/PAD-1 family protein [Sphingomonas rubra]|uniref:Proteasome lid subunit RPN8/RPN11, contains Jab1/MPN metalloenzyme (JAMM) motif n=1 Tax=Sphingomonas rubra TaxID=634430 RepID=A0A1I5SWI7_9SPHN|nr:M67 family metallopeptidase [Sphingomonas rubra]SFP75110.1 Proteasome lid subunit RPN8/RPN11, contains Jab1/MPN metalloenzyme (JAMM) motif [Sphingomonas rubra]
MLEISRESLDRIVAETMRDPVVEACGLLLGSGLRVDAVEPCRNVAADPARWFEIDPAALIAAHRRARAGEPAVIGCFHSHPGGRAEPSPRDAADAAPDGGIWIVVAGDHVTAWRAVAGGPLHGRFEPLHLPTRLPRRSAASTTGASHRDLS